MGFFKRLFGSGTVKFECETTDGDLFKGEMPFEGCFNEKDCIEEVIRVFEFKHDKKVKRARLTNAIGESRGGNTSYSGDWYGRS